jgi:hypothetical protein
MMLQGGKGLTTDSKPKSLSKMAMAPESRKVPACSFNFADGNWKELSQSRRGEGTRKKKGTVASEQTLPISTIDQPPDGGIEIIAEITTTSTEYAPNDAHADDIIVKELSGRNHIKSIPKMYRCLEERPP